MFHLHEFTFVTASVVANEMAVHKKLYKHTWKNHKALPMNSSQCRDSHSVRGGGNRSGARTGADTRWRATDSESSGV